MCSLSPFWYESFLRSTSLGQGVILDHRVIARVKKISQNSTVADFSKIDIVHTKIDTVQLKFGEKFGIGRVQFFSTR
jgi:hypothetical protein